MAIKTIDLIISSCRCSDIRTLSLIHVVGVINMNSILENKQYLTDSIISEIMSRLESESENAISAKDIVPSMSLRDDLGMDSMQAVSLTLDLEDSLGISIDDEDLIKLDTVSDLLEIIESKLSEKNG